jgi:hypothetical protein
MAEFKIVPLGLETVNVMGLRNVGVGSWNMG